jgi:chlorite dismutase
MTPDQARTEETRAMERALNAMKQVQTAFASLQSHYPPNGSGKPSQMALQTFDAALEELENAQAEFDALLGDLLDGNR